MQRPDLRLTKDDIQGMSSALKELLKQSDSKCALLVDQDGVCLLKEGFTKKLNTDGLAALVAGSFASTREMAKLVGESEFSVLFHQGENDHIHNLQVDDFTILVVLFDRRTTIGMVRLYCKDAAKVLRDVLKVARERVIAPPSDNAIDLGEGAEDRLNELFDQPEEPREDN